MRACLAGLVMTLLAQGAAAQNNYLESRERIEWDAGGLYEGRFADGTPFQINLAYPRPRSAPERAQTLWNRYWYPRHFTGVSLPLTARSSAPGTLRLEQMQDGNKLAEIFEITLSGDGSSGTGRWTSNALHRQQDFTLHRLATYHEVALEEPPPVIEGRGPGEPPPGPFVYSALFPQLADAGARAWVKKQVATCDQEADAECHNSVLIDWSSPQLLSLNASRYSYSAGGAHGSTRTQMQHYAADKTPWAPLVFHDFVVESDACRANVSERIVARLRARALTGAEHGTLDNRPEPRFLALPNGLEFHFDPYEVGAYANGMPSVFVPAAELKGCVKRLPAAL
jgi:hypothetical protein